MANYTIAQLRTAGINPASVDAHGFPANVFLDYEFDGAKRSTVAADTVDIFEIPAYAAFVVQSAAVSVVKPGTSGATTVGVNLGAAAAAGTAVTGLTAWAGDAAAGTKLVKLATAANSIISTTTPNYVKLQFSTQALGTGKIRVRIQGTLMEAPSAVA